LTDLRLRLQEFTTTHAHQLLELWRYYKIGVINSIFGYSFYSLLIFLGANIYVAQLLSTIIGVTFNYFTYTRHVFHHTSPHVSRFMGAYAINYCLGVGFLTVFHHFFPSAYLAGFLSLIATSIVNYGMLKFFVFTRQKARS
jgi:putative flippase GtrA